MISVELCGVNLPMGALASAGGPRVIQQLPLAGGSEEVVIRLRDRQPVRLVVVDQLPALSAAEPLPEP